MNNRTQNTNTKAHPVLLGVMCAIISEIIYGFAFIFIKNITSLVNPLYILSWRFIVAWGAFSVLIAAGVVKVDYRGKKIGPALAVGLFNPVLYLILESIGISLTTASETGTIVSGTPIVALILSALILKKRTNRFQLTGIIVTIAGVLVTVYVVGATASFSLPGYLILMAAVMSYAMYGIMVEKAGAFTGLELTYIMLAFAAVLFTAAAVVESLAGGGLFAFLTLPFTNRQFLAAALYLGLGTSFLGYFLSNVAISNIGMNRFSSFIGIETVVSIVAGVIILRETFLPGQIVGVVMIVAGVYIANVRQK